MRLGRRTVEQAAAGIRPPVTFDGAAYMESQEGDPSDSETNMCQRIFFACIEVKKQTAVDQKQRMPGCFNWTKPYKDMILVQKN